MVSELVRALQERYSDPQLHPLVHEAIREIWRLEAWQKRALEANTPYFAHTTADQPDESLGRALISYVRWSYGVTPTQDQFGKLFHATVDAAEAIFDGSAESHGSDGSHRPG